jgi:hypothetical protein
MGKYSCESYMLEHYLTQKMNSEELTSIHHGNFQSCNVVKKKLQCFNYRIMLFSYIRRKFNGIQNSASVLLNHPFFKIK